VPVDALDDRQEDDGHDDVPDDVSVVFNSSEGPGRHCHDVLSYDEPLTPGSILETCLGDAWQSELTRRRNRNRKNGKESCRPDRYGAVDRAIWGYSQMMGVHG
jgi:hypothetical protein